MQEVETAYRSAVRRAYGDAILRYSAISYQGQSFYIGLAQRDERGSIIPAGPEYIYNKKQVLEMTQELMQRAEQQAQTEEG